MNKAASKSWRMLFILLPACCAALLSAREHVEKSTPQRSGRTSIVASVRKNLGQPWLFIDTRLCLGRELDVKRVSLAGDEVRLLVSTSGHLAGTTIQLDISKLNEKQPWIEGSVVSWYDTPPFKTSWGEVSGQVWITSMDWAEESPFVVHFDLQGTRDGQPHSVSGEVTLPK